MFYFDSAGCGLFSIPTITNSKTRSISAENPDGEAGKGGNYASNLGIGRKGRPCVTLASGSVTTLADIKGPGVIQHI